MTLKRKILENSVKNLAKKNCTNVDVSDRSGAESCGSQSKRGGRVARGGQRGRFSRSSVDNEDSDRASSNKTKRGGRLARGGQRSRFSRSSVDNEDSATRDSCSDLRRLEHSLEISPKYLRTQDDNNHRKDSNEIFNISLPDFNLFANGSRRERFSTAEIAASSTRVDDTDEYDSVFEDYNDYDDDEPDNDDSEASQIVNTNPQPGKIKFLGATKAAGTSGFNKVDLQKVTPKNYKDPFDAKAILKDTNHYFESFRTQSNKIKELEINKVISKISYF